MKNFLDYKHYDCLERHVVDKVDKFGLVNDRDLNIFFIRFQRKVSYKMAALNLVFKTGLSCQLVKSIHCLSLFCLLKP